MKPLAHSGINIGPADYDYDKTLGTLRYKYRNSLIIIMMKPWVYSGTNIGPADYNYNKTLGTLRYKYRNSLIYI